MERSEEGGVWTWLLTRETLTQHNSETLRRKKDKKDKKNRYINIHEVAELYRWLLVGLVCLERVRVCRHSGIRFVRLWSLESGVDNAQTRRRQDWKRHCVVVALKR